MQVSIKQLAMENDNNASHPEIDRLLSTIEQSESNLVSLEQDEAQITMENLAGNLAQGLTMSIVWQAMGPKGYLTVRRIAEDYADLAKSWTAWIDFNQIKRNALRSKIKALRNAVSDNDSIHGGSIITYLGDNAKHLKSTKDLIHLLSTDLIDTEKYLTAPSIATAQHAKTLTEFICDKDNDFTIGWDEAVDGCRSLIEKSISDHVKFGTKKEVAGHSSRGLGMPEGTEFSPLLLGNVVSATNWSERHEEAKHIMSTTSALSEYSYGIHDLIHVPKNGNKYAIGGKASKKELLDVLDIAEEYLNQAEEINLFLSKHGAKNIKTILMSNWFSTAAAYGVKTKSGGPWATPLFYQLGKVAFSRNYRRIYTLMRCCVTWSMKLQRKTVARNLDVAEHLINFVKLNSK